MNFMQRKIIAAISFAIMFGGTALFALIAYEKGLPGGREAWINLWPITTGIGTVFSFLALRKDDPRHPLPPGSWHLTLTDLLATSLTFGALLGILRGTCDDLEFIQAAFISTLITAVMISGLLCASRINIPRGRRALFGLTFALGATGLLILGGVVSIALLIFIMERTLIKLSDLWINHNSSRLALAAMLIGLPAARYCYKMWCEAQPRPKAAIELPSATATEDLKRHESPAVPVPRHE